MGCRWCLWVAALAMVRTGLAQTSATSGPEHSRPTRGPVFVAMDSWIYPALMRLAALGYISDQAANFFYFHILKEDQRASHCQECGECVERCPQHIPIPDVLKEVVREFESQPA